MAQQDEYVRTALRLPPALHQRIHDAADAAGRSFNAEIIARLTASFEAQGIEARLASIERLLGDMSKSKKP